ncbi:MAG TPA: N-acetylmuramic acid 6-phosphate etherase [Bacteroidetes bacterium]|jgi:N-acetylmuramic acid 6-phosphate etherase|nr:N-acetylmuramic acid 6-phosphate etherase [Bacteroidota bacterium]
MNSAQKDRLAALATEQRNPRSKEIDHYSTLDILKLINNEDKLVAFAVERELGYIAEAVELIVHAFKNGGRLVYVGAGTSGRLGILDAAECPPTFGTDPKMVVGLMAGGEPAVFRSQEGAEDNEAQALRDIENLNINKKDVVCGIAASRRTPYVVAAIERARERGAMTIYITTNPRREFDLQVDVAICPEVGAEVIMGSTRMKSGTAQKLVLNMLTTTAMIKMGKVYENMMVDLQLTNEKLTERAKRIIMIATGIEYRVAESLLNAASGHVKTAIVMAKTGLSADEAEVRLREANGFVRPAISS